MGRGSLWVDASHLRRLPPPRRWASRMGWARRRRVTLCAISVSLRYASRASPADDGAGLVPATPSLLGRCASRGQLNQLPRSPSGLERPSGFVVRPPAGLLAHAPVPQRLSTSFRRTSPPPEGPCF